jgi:hypothetical protein
VDAGVQGLQGKAERVKPSETLQRLLNVHAEKVSLRRRHIAVAGVAAEYDVNNAYQYVIAREDEHLSWLASAIHDLGGDVPPDPTSGTVPPPAGADAMGGLALADAEALDAFVAAWRPRVAELSHARHQLMLNLMLGEMQEQARLFHQAAAGSLDLLGRRTGGARIRGSVLATRWVE